MNLICKGCMVVMISGTSYYRQNNKNMSQQYKECPKCHDRKNVGKLSFQEVLNNVKSKKII